MFKDISFIGFFEKGGVSVMFLALLSIISIAVMLERAWAFYRFKRNLAISSDSLGKAFDESGLEVTARLSATQSSPLSAVFLSGYKKRGKGRAEVESAMELAGRGELSKLERYLGVLGTIGSTAPFIGLFGTVLGIIRAFSDLAIAEGASPAAVADGIAEALIATAAGLFVAIPAVIAYNYFVRSASRCALMLETEASRFTDGLTGENGLEPKER